MNIYKKNLSNSIKVIEKDQVYTIKANRSGNEIVCLEGTIWITQYGDGVDRILKPGDIYQSRISNKIIVQGLESSRIRLNSLHKVDVIEHYIPVVEPQMACAPCA